MLMEEVQHGLGRRMNPMERPCPAQHSFQMTCYKCENIFFLEGILSVFKPLLELTHKAGKP